MPWGICSAPGYCSLVPCLPVPYRYFRKPRTYTIAHLSVFRIMNCTCLYSDVVSRTLPFLLAFPKDKHFFHVMLIISEANRESSLNQHLCLTIIIIRLIIFWRHPRNPIMHVRICVCWKWHHPYLHILKQACLFCVLFVCFIFIFPPFQLWYTDWWESKSLCY